jgi:hydrogenase nickel incorporation protein HypB
MCATCGCTGEFDDHDGHEHDAHGHTHHAHEHTHHAHEHGHTHAHEHRSPSLLKLEADVLERNAQLATVNRRRIEARQLLALNLVSSPGSGKTTLLERMVHELGDRRTICVIQGDQATERDADRVRAAGARAVQINTGTGCHLDARMVARALEELSPPEGALLVIENVGNLVCPALFDLGETARIGVASVTEGADKPLKYPYLFRGCDVVLLNKIDLLPYVDFDTAFFDDCMRRVNPNAIRFSISATRGDGLTPFYDWVDASSQRSKTMERLSG